MNLTKRQGEVLMDIFDHGYSPRRRINHTILRNLEKSGVVTVTRQGYPESVSSVVLTESGRKEAKKIDARMTRKTWNR